MTYCYQMDGQVDMEKSEVITKSPNGAGGDEPSTSYGSTTISDFEALGASDFDVRKTEETKLISRRHSKRSEHGGGKVDEVLNEFYSLLKLSLPITGTYLLEMLPGVVSIMLVGHLGQGEQRQLYIDASSIATVFVNLTGLSVGIGLASAMDTLCSQAYGAGETAKMGIYLQTGVIVLSAAFFVVTVVNVFCETILLTLGQPEEISHMAGSFILYVLPGLPFVYLYELLRKTQQAQHITLPMLYVAAAANVINFCLGYYLVYYTSWGFLGAALARTIANVAEPFLLLIYMVRDGSLKSVWNGLRIQEALLGVAEFLELGVAGMLQVCFEWWAFEVLYIFCGWLPDAEVAIGANAVFMNVASTAYMFYLGMSISVNVRTGNALGAGDAHRARLSSRIALAMSAALSLLLALFLIVFRRYLPVLFTPDPEIDSLAESLAFLAALLQFPDVVNAVVQGSLRGSGRQRLGASLNFAAYYLLGIPFGALLAFFFRQGLGGLWIGLICALSGISCIGVYILERSDWQGLAEIAKKRLQPELTSIEEFPLTISV